MSYGIKLYSSTGETKILTPDDGTVIAAGSLTMPNSLNADNTYGVDVSLGGTYNEDEISVLVVPRRPNFAVNQSRWTSGGTLYYNTFYLESTKTYYTRNDSTGVMSTYSAGNKTSNQKDTWNPVLSVFPVAFWDKMGNTTFSSVRLFAATAYLIRDTHNDTNFSLSGTASGSGGVGGGNGNTVNNIKDGNANTWYGQGCSASLGNSCSWSYSAQVSFSPRTITKAELYHRPYSILNGGNYANGHYAVSLYYGGAWHEIFSGDWSGNYDPCPTDEGITTYKCGHWRGVTGIKVAAGGSAQARWNYNTYSEHVTRELRAWGPASSNDEENKIVYSIGNQGIETVDYMICRKKFA